MWRDILLSNRDELLAPVAGCSGQALERFEQAIARDGYALEDLIPQASQARAGLAHGRPKPHDD